MKPSVQAFPLTAFHPVCYPTRYQTPEERAALLAARLEGERHEFERELDAVLADIAAIEKAIARFAGDSCFSYVINHASVDRLRDDVDNAITLFWKGMLQNELSAIQFTIGTMWYVIHRWNDFEKKGPQ